MALTLSLPADLFTAQPGQILDFGASPGTPSGDMTKGQALTFAGSTMGLLLGGTALALILLATPSSTGRRR